MRGTWRSSIGPEWQGLRRATQEPPHEPDGPCEAWSCPRTGSDAAGAILCAFHRHEETPRASRRTTGHRSEQ